MDAHLSSHHRDTIAKIFSHPASGNIEWRQVLSLLENIGTTTEERNGKFKVALGPRNRSARAPAWERHQRAVDRRLATDPQAGRVRAGRWRVDTGRARPRPWRCTVGRTYLVPLTVTSRLSTTVFGVQCTRRRVRVVVNR